MKKITFLLLCCCMATSLSFAQSFPSSPMATIPDNNCDATNEFSIDLSGESIGILGTTNQLDFVSVDISHTWVSDITITLVAPDATEVLLIDGEGGSGDDFTGTNFVDGGTDPITPPFTGMINPAEALTAGFNGVDADGVWILRVCDGASGDEGTLNGWSLNFGPAPLCSAAVYSAAVNDSCNPDGTGSFTVEIEVTDAGDAGGVFSDGINADEAVVVGTVTMGPYNSGDSVTIEYLNTDMACDSTVGTFSFTCPQPAPANDECSGAIEIACDGQYTGDTTNANPEVDDPGFCGTSAGTAGAVWYTFTGANSNDAGAASGTVGDEVTLDLSLSTFDTKIRVFTGVCGDLTCVDGDDDGGTGTTSLLTLTTTVGTEYYVLVHGFSSAAGEYTLDVSCVAPPLCVAPTIDSATINDSGCNPDGSGTFSVDIVVSDAGDGGVFSDGINPDEAVAVGTVTMGPYNTGDSVTIELTAPDAACSSTVGTFEYSCPLPPPANDEASGALDLPVGDTMCETPVLADNESATDSDEGTNLADCSGSDPEGDVWYKVTVPETGEVNIETSTTGEITDTVMIVYRGTPGSLIEIECDDDDSASGFFSLIELNATDDGIAAGDVLYVRVWEWNNDLKGTFNVCAWSPSSLSVDEADLGAFSYYPNPVKNTLTLNAQNTIENVTMYNMLGQEVLRANPNSVDSDIDMSGLANGSYFVKVTIANVTKTIRVIKQ